MENRCSPRALVKLSPTCYQHSASNSWEPVALCHRTGLYISCTNPSPVFVVDVVVVVVVVFATVLAWETKAYKCLSVRSSL